MSAESFRLANAILALAAVAGFLLWMLLHWRRLRTEADPLFAAIGWMLPTGGLVLLGSVAAGSAFAYVNHATPNPVTPALTVALVLIVGGLWMIRKR